MGDTKGLEILESGEVEGSGEPIGANDADCHTVTP